MKKIIKNWKSFNEKLSDETLKSASDKARGYGDEETADKFIKHSKNNVGKYDAINLYYSDPAKNAPMERTKFTLEGSDINTTYDMWNDQPNKMNLAFRLNSDDDNNKIFNEPDNGGSLDLFLNFDLEGREKFDSYDFIDETDGESRDDIKFDIVEAKKAIRNFKKILKEDIDKADSMDRIPSDEKGIFIEHLKGILGMLNYRMLPLIKK